MDGDALNRISPTARRAIETNDLLVSPIALLEIQFLHEVGRHRDGPAAVLANLSAQLGLRQCDLAFPQVVHAAVGQTWTRDPFDRLIVGQAAAARRPLVTADQTILDNYPDAIW